jgi:hypothetical protein
LATKAGLWRQWPVQLPLSGIRGQRLAPPILSMLPELRAHPSECGCGALHGTLERCRPPDLFFLETSFAPVGYGQARATRHHDSRDEDPFIVYSACARSRSEWNEIGPARTAEVQHRKGMLDAQLGLFQGEVPCPTNYTGPRESCVDARGRRSGEAVYRNRRPHQCGAEKGPASRVRCVAIPSGSIKLNTRSLIPAAGRHCDSTWSAIPCGNSSAV